VVIRYFCHADEPTQPESWSHLGYRYLLALSRLEHDTSIDGIYAVPIVPVGAGCLYAAKSLWYPLADFFGSWSGPRRFVNIVCGEAVELVKYWTKDVPNVALVGLPDSVDKKTQLNWARDMKQAVTAYDLVVCPARSAFSALCRVQAKPRPIMLAPDHRRLKSALESLV
jgi:hypothetical protein